MSTSYKEILRRHAIVIVRSRDDASYVSEDALPHEQAMQVVSELESVGVEASSAPDHDDASIEWLYVTPPDVGAEQEGGRPMVNFGWRTDAASGEIEALDPKDALEKLVEQNEWSARDDGDIADGAWLTIFDADGVPVLRRGQMP